MLPKGTVDVRALRASLQAGEPGTLVDVREALEFAGGRAAGATLLPMSELTARHEELRAMESPIYLISFAKPATAPSSADSG